MPAEAKTRVKSEQTRERILEAALELFREQSFEAATMRQIAARAGMATGAAYYYFDSKDAIVLAFYDQAQKEMAPGIEDVLETARGLEERLRGVIEVKLRYFAPSRDLLGALSGHTNPKSPLSPFGEGTRAIREQDIAFLARAVEGSGVHVAEDLRDYLPRLLWMYQMGIILFWITDGSAGQAKTKVLLEKSLSVVVRLIQLAGLPLTKPLRKMVTGLVDVVTE
ncbi:MAG: TetR family transcriptional regulator [Acidobacteriota bacterium]